MKKYLCAGLAVFLLLCGAGAAVAATAPSNASKPAPLSSAEGSLAKGGNDFACAMYALLRKDKGNLFFSPFSVSSGLGMAYSGAKGKTAEEMAKALRFPAPQAAVAPAFAGLLRRLEAAQTAGNVQLSIANSLWPQQGVPLSEAFVRVVREDYGAELTPVDYRNDEAQARATINRWVAEKTQDTIRDLLAQPLSQQTSLLLVNAVYFNGNWARPFAPEQTAEAFFYADSGPQPVPLMQQTGIFRHSANGTLHMLELPYAGNDLSMLVLLPAAKTPGALAKLERNLSAKALAQWREGLRQTQVAVFLPKFSITWGTQSLVKALQKLGMNEAFSKHADFSGMNGKRTLYLDNVLHKAFVDVDEKGTEAAAATAVAVATRALPLEPEQFRADRPFVFLIQDRATGVVLFMGRLAEPEKTKP